MGRCIALLTDVINNRLYERVRERGGLVYSVDMAFDPLFYADAGFFTLALAPFPEKMEVAVDLGAWPPPTHSCGFSSCEHSMEVGMLEAMVADALACVCHEAIACVPACVKLLACNCWRRPACVHACTLTAWICGYICLYLYIDDTSWQSRPSSVMCRPMASQKRSLRSPGVLRWLRFPPPSSHPLSAIPPSPPSLPTGGLASN